MMEREWLWCFVESKKLSEAFEKFLQTDFTHESSYITLEDFRKMSEKKYSEYFKFVESEFDYDIEPVNEERINHLFLKMISISEGNNPEILEIHIGLTKWQFAVAPPIGVSAREHKYCIVYNYERAVKECLLN